MNNHRTYRNACCIALIGLLFYAVQPTAYGQFAEYVEISSCTQTVISGNPNTGEYLCPDFSNVLVFRAPDGDSEILSPRSRVLVGESVIIQTNIWDDSQLRVNDKLSLVWKQNNTRETAEDFLSAQEIQDRPKKMGNLFFPFVHRATIEAGDLSGILGDVTYQIFGEFNVPNNGGLRRDNVSSPELTFTITTIQGFIPNQRVSVGDSISIDLNSIFSDVAFTSPLTYELLSVDSSIVTPSLEKSILTLEGLRNDITSIQLKVKTENHYIIETFKVQVTAIEGAIDDQRLKRNETRILEIKSFFTHPTDDLRFGNLVDTYNRDVLAVDTSADQGSISITGGEIGETDITLSVNANDEVLTETFNVQVTDIEGALPDVEVCIAGNNSTITQNLSDIFTLNSANLAFETTEHV